MTSNNLTRCGKQILLHKGEGGNGKPVIKLVAPSQQAIEIAKTQVKEAIKDVDELNTLKLSPKKCSKKSGTKTTSKDSRGPRVWKRRSKKVKAAK